MLSLHRKTEEKVAQWEFDGREAGNWGEERLRGTLEALGWERRTGTAGGGDSGGGWRLIGHTKYGRSKHRCHLNHVLHLQTMIT